VHNLDSILVCTASPPNIIKRLKNNKNNVTLKYRGNEISLKRTHPTTSSTTTVKQDHR